MDAYASCRNCNASLTFGQAYCPGCGQKIVTRRLTLREIGHDLVQAFLQADRSVLSLAGLLLVRPGTVALEYVQGRRRRYFGPFAFLAVTVGLVSAVIALTGFHAIRSDNPNAVADVLQSHINLVLLAEVPLLTAFSRLLDLHGGLTFAEHLVLATYTASMRALFVTLVLIPIWYLFSPGGATARYMYYGYLLIWLIYFGFATSQFLQRRRVLSWCKGISAAILTWASTQVLASLAGSVLS